MGEGVSVAEKPPPHASSHRPEQLAPSPAGSGLLTPGMRAGLRAEALPSPLKVLPREAGSPCPTLTGPLAAGLAWWSLQSKGLSRVFSNTAVQKHQFFGTRPPSRLNKPVNLTAHETGLLGVLLGSCDAFKDGGRHSLL